MQTYLILPVVAALWIANHYWFGWSDTTMRFITLGGLMLAFPAPILVLVSLAMALVGVVYLFAWSDASFDSSARIGLVLLFGIVVNNAILLVSRYRHEAALTLKAKFGGDPEAEAGILPGTNKKLGGSDLCRVEPAHRRGLLRRAIARGTEFGTFAVGCSKVRCISRLRAQAAEMSKHRRGTLPA